MVTNSAYASSHRCFDTLRTTVFLLNFFFWIAGLIVFIFGLWLKFDPAVSEFVSLHGGSTNFPIVCYLLIAAGAIMTFIGFLGCCGSWRLNQGMLFAFFVILVTVFCLQLACAILSYNQQDRIRRYIDESMHETIRKRYAIDLRYRSIFDRIQTEFQCCGVRSYYDWLHSSWGEDLVKRAELGIGHPSVGKVPRSCCNEEGLREYPTNCGISFDKIELWTYEPFLHTKGCSDAIYDSAYNNLNLVIAVCVIVGVLQLFGMILSMLLCCWINSKSSRKNDD